MSGSGKSTLSIYLELFFLKKNYSIYILDGDDVRDNDKKKLGFDYKSVLNNNLRISKLCLNLRREYDVVVVPVISPYEGIRKQVRLMLQPNFHLIYLKSDIGSLRDRDTKGLYSAADQGVISDLIGYSDVNPYDVPINTELTIETGNDTTINDSIEQLYRYINKSVFAD